ncbi:hypothetical protein GOC91_28860 [Sinorhizobium medicae]|nr:hypothetical protein [Sinorhizobium medicae]MDX0882823.1 hypothetical protein [Sinorhizobium medicae]
MLRAFTIALLLLLPLQSVHADPEQDEARAGDEKGATDAEIKDALGSDLVAEITIPQRLAFGESDFAGWAAKAKEAHLNLKPSPGEGSKLYDIILQPGHFPRVKGRTGGQGRYVNEQQVAAWVAGLLAEELKKREVNVLVIPADGFTRPLKSKIFLSLHTDSTRFPCSVGPSVGYDSSGDAKGMHGIALALAMTLGIDPVKFMRDSYTAGLKNYYAFSSMDAQLFEGVLEMSELTCPEDEKNLLSRAETLSTNLAWAVVFALRPPQQ